MNGKVNSDSDFNDNSFEKVEENQKAIWIIQKYKNYIRRNIAKRVIGYLMSGIFEHGDVVGAKKLTHFSRYQKGFIIDS